MLTWLLQSYWRDEAFSVLLAQKPFSEIFRIVAQDYSPPLYFFLLRIWILLFGSTEVATRSLSFIFYLLTLVTIYFFLRKFSSMRGWSLVLFIGLIGLLHPLMSVNAFEARMYSMSAWLATLSWYLLLRKKWFFYALATLAGLYTQYFMMIIVGVQGLYLIVTVLSNKSKIVPIIRSNISAILLFLAPMLLFAPWMGFVLASHNNTLVQSFWIPKPTLTDLLTIPSYVTFGYDSFSGFKFNPYPFSIVLYALVTLSFLKKKQLKSTLICALLLWIFIPAILIWIFAQLSTSLFLPRYLIVSAPAVVILAAISLERLKPVLRVVFGLVLVSLIFVFILARSNFPKTHQLFPSTKENLRAKIEKVKSQANSSDYLVVESELDYHVAQLYWFDESHVKIMGKTYAEIPSYVGKSLIPESAVLKKPYPKFEGYILKGNRKIEIYNYLGPDGTP